MTEGARSSGLVQDGIVLQLGAVKAKESRIARAGRMRQSFTAAVIPGRAVAAVDEALGK